MAASQTAADRIAAARAEIRSRNLDSARALLRQLVDSPSAADRSDRAVAFLWLGIISYYEGDDSATARSFRASLALNALLSGDDLVRVDSSLASVVREVLPQLRFRPAQAGSQPVPALIELRFDIRPEGLDWVRYEVSTP